MISTRRAIPLAAALLALIPLGLAHPQGVRADGPSPPPKAPKLKVVPTPDDDDDLLSKGAGLGNAQPESPPPPDLTNQPSPAKPKAKSPPDTKVRRTSSSEDGSGPIGSDSPDSGRAQPGSTKSSGASLLDAAPGHDESPQPPAQVVEPIAPKKAQPVPSKEKTPNRDAKPSGSVETSPPLAAPSVDGSGDGTGTASSRPAMPAGPQNIAVTVEKIAPAAVALGQPMSYTIVVRNAGTHDVYDVVVEDEVPSSAQFKDSQPSTTPQGQALSWKLGTLAAGQEQKIQVRITPQQEGNLDQSAIVRFSGGSSSRTEVARPKVKVAISGPETAMVGDSVTFMLQATNPGPVPLSDVRMRANLDAGLQHPQGTEIELGLDALQPGETKQAPLTVSITTTGSLKCQATATADGQVRDQAVATVNAVQAKLDVAVSGPQKSHLGGNTAYKLTVSNPGNGPTGNVHVTDTLPPGFDVVEAWPQAQFDRLNRTILWDIPPIAAGSEQHLTVKLKSTQPGNLCTRVQATSDRNLHSEAQCCTAVEGIAALTMEVVDTEDPVEVEGHTTYEIRVINQGTTAATNIIVTAELPQGLEFQGANGPMPFKYDRAKKTVAFEAVPRLVARADTIYRITARALTPGDLRFKAYLKADQLNEALAREESTRVFSDK